MKNRALSGFSLIEMSIVLVIIGTITGGILLGKSMLTTSRVQTVMTDANNYITAVGNFKQQYQALPGDIATATSLWGADSVSCPTGGGATGTCNGNGDGQIGGVSGSGHEYEVFRFWQQLNLAGLINQKNSGVPGSASTLQAVIGTNVPAGSVEGSGWSVFWAGGGATSNSVDSTDFFPGYWGNVLEFGTVYSTALTSGPVLTAEQAAGIDSKIDDGAPGTGKVRSAVNGSNFAPSCATTAVASTATYNVSNSNKVCSLFFLTGY